MAGAWSAGRGVAMACSPRARGWGRGRCSQARLFSVGFPAHGSVWPSVDVGCHLRRATHPSPLSLSEVPDRARGSVIFSARRGWHTASSSTDRGKCPCLRSGGPHPVAPGKAASGTPPLSHFASNPSRETETDLETTADVCLKPLPWRLGPECPGHCTSHRVSRVTGRTPYGPGITEHDG